MSRPGLFQRTKYLCSFAFNGQRYGTDAFTSISFLAKVAIPVVSEYLKLYNEAEVIGHRKQEIEDFFKTIQSHLTEGATDDHSSDTYKHFNSAKQRFLKLLIINFFRTELPRFFGPQLRDKLGDEIVKLISKAMPEKEHVKPGQVVWTAIDTRNRPDSPNRKFVYVVLTLKSNLREKRPGSSGR